MTHDPDARAPDEINPHTVRRERDRTDMSVVMMLSVIALFIAFGLWFYATSGDHTIATEEVPAAKQTTTGAAMPERPLPTTPTPPTVPSPQRE